jgi:hypothetical protein
MFDMKTELGRFDPDYFNLTQLLPERFGQHVDMVSTTLDLVTSNELLS